MSKQFGWTRRGLLRAAGAGLVGAAASSVSSAAGPRPQGGKARSHIKQSVCRWCYGRIPLERLAAAVAGMGYRSVELLDVEEFDVVRAQGLTCAMLRCASIADGLNRIKNHERIERELRRHIEFAADNGIPNVICMAGNRGGMDDHEGLDNCATGLKRVLRLAEAKKVTVCMEGLNSKVDHKDYMYDHTDWGVRLFKKVGSPRFRLLYDIYHMQIMEGDVIRTIRTHHEAIAHYHTGGVPGRHEIDQTQELNYPAIVKAILDTGYQGYLGQEFIPLGDPLSALAEGFRICDV